MAHRNRHLARCGLSLACLLLLAPAQPAAAQDGEGARLSEEDDARIRTWIEAAREREDSTRTLLGSGYIVAGTLTTALGVASLASPELIEQPLLSPMASTFMLTGGLFFIGSGLATLLTASSVEALHATLPDGRLREGDVRRLERRLFLASENALDGRITTAIFGGAIALSGSVGMALMGVSSIDPTEAPLDYALAGVVSLAGVLSLVFSLFETQAESDWREYRDGLDPSPRPSASVRPTGNGFVLTF